MNEEASNCKDQQEQNNEEGEQNFFSASWRMVKRGSNWCFDKIGTTEGGLVLATLWNFEQVVGNFLWGFDWERHTNTTAETKATIQEMGAMLIVAGYAVAGVVIPVAVYSYRKKHPAPAGEINSN